MSNPSTVVAEEDDAFEPQVIYLVNVDESEAIGSMERDSLTIEVNEESDSWEPHSARNIQTSATTTNPSLTFTIARDDDNEMLEALGIRDDEDNSYIRGDDRELDRLEVWYYNEDADPTSDNADLIDAFEDVRIDAESQDTETVVAMWDITIDVNGDVYWDDETDLGS